MERVGFLSIRKSPSWLSVSAWVLHKTFVKIINPSSVMTAKLQQYFYLYSEMMLIWCIIKSIYFTNKKIIIHILWFIIFIVIFTSGHLSILGGSKPLYRIKVLPVRNAQVLILAQNDFGINHGHEMTLEFIYLRWVSFHFVYSKIHSATPAQSRTCCFSGKTDPSVSTYMSSLLLFF